MYLWELTFLFRRTFLAGTRIRLPLRQFFDFGKLLNVFFSMNVQQCDTNLCFFICLCVLNCCIFLFISFCFIFILFCDLKVYYCYYFGILLNVSITVAQRVTNTILLCYCICIQCIAFAALLAWLLSQ